MSDTTKKKIAHTFFTKGHKPHNTKYDGHERIDAKDGYVLIRVKEGVYRHKHRVLWEHHHGAIPRGMVIAFRDGDKQNITIDNLEMITRKENVRRNTIHRYPREIINTIKSLSKLNKLIDAKQDRRSS